MYDDLTGHDLDRNEVMKSMLNNVEGLASMGVWDVAPRKQCIGRTGREPIRGRWGGINKGDDKKVCRSRYVLMEIRKMHGENAKEGGNSSSGGSKVVDLPHRVQRAQSARNGRASSCSSTFPKPI